MLDNAFQVHIEKPYCKRVPMPSSEVAVAADKYEQMTMLYKSLQLPQALLSRMVGCNERISRKNRCGLVVIARLASTQAIPSQAKQILLAVGSGWTQFLQEDISR